MSKFSAYINYLSLEKKYSKHTVVAYVNDLDAFLFYFKTEFNSEFINDCNYAQIRSWIVVLVDRGLSNRSVNRKLASLKSYYNFLLLSNQIKVSPLLKHKALKTAKKLQVPFSVNEMDSVLVNGAFDESFEGFRDKFMIELFYATGIRKAELIGLSMTDIDFDYLFLTVKGGKIYNSLVYRVINSYFSIASTKLKKSPHVLRHTFATHLINEGADLNSVKELLGHTSLAATQIYIHNSMAKLKEVYANSHPRNMKN
jgi:integrase/recombinase XerC